MTQYATLPASVPALTDFRLTDKRNLVLTLHTPTGAKRLRFDLKRPHAGLWMVDHQSGTISFRRDMREIGDEDFVREESIGALWVRVQRDLARVLFSMFGVSQIVLDMWPDDAPSALAAA